MEKFLPNKSGGTDHCGLGLFDKGIFEKQMNLWVLWCSLHSNRILEPWLCRWVPFLTRTGPISIPFFKNSGPFLIPFSSGTRNSHTVYDIFWMEFYQSYECSRWVDIVLHCLLHSPSCFQEGAGVGSRPAQRFYKNQDIRYKKNEIWNKNPTDQPFAKLAM